MWSTYYKVWEFIKVKRNKLSLLTLAYKLFSMEESKNIQSMIKMFQIMLNKLIGYIAM